MSNWIESDEHFFSQRSTGSNLLSHSFILDQGIPILVQSQRFKHSVLERLITYPPVNEHSPESMVGKCFIFVWGWSIFRGELLAFFSEGTQHFVISFFWHSRPRPVSTRKTPWLRSGAKSLFGSGRGEDLGSHQLMGMINQQDSISRRKKSQAVFFNGWTCWKKNRLFLYKT